MINKIFFKKYKDDLHQIKLIGHILRFVVGYQTSIYNYILQVLKTENRVVV